MTKVETPLFNTYGDKLNFRISFPNVNRRVKLYFTFRIRKRRSYLLNQSDLAVHMSPPASLQLMYYLGAGVGETPPMKGTKVWGNSLLCASFPISYPFDLMPMDASERPYTQMAEDTHAGSMRRSWLITGDVVYWKQRPELIEVKCENNVKLYIHCSPHNPVGRVWTREEQEKVLEICRENNVLVLSDEIHQDFVIIIIKYLHYA